MSGQTLCWGLDADGQATPAVNDLDGIYAGGAHSCGLDADDTLTCWGSDAAGQVTLP
jgi:alpha-tubulin suppressor-like RCC1 family protein